VPCFSLGHYVLIADSIHAIPQRLAFLVADIGRGKLMPGVLKMQHAFKTPGLREISRRSPYMHDGSLATLEQVVDHYDKGGVDRPSRADLMKPLGLTPHEKSDLVTFLKTLTSDLNPTALPVLPR